MSRAAEITLYKLATVTGINAKSVAATTLYTVPAGSTFIPLMVIVRVTSFTVGSKATQAVFSLGSDASDYNDFQGSTTFTVDAANDITVVSSIEYVAAAGTFKINITTGSDATTETWAADVFGYLL